VLKGEKRPTWCCRIWRPICPASDSADAARMEHLIDLAIEFSQAHLKPNGALLVKCFKDMGFNESC
jgi:23S rRNA U2552 (ribose-2'-O)-methylase RlmE/FtsJ